MGTVRRMTHWGCLDHRATPLGQGICLALSQCQARAFRPDGSHKQ